MEVIDQAILAEGLGFLTSESLATIRTQGAEISRMLMAEYGKHN